MSEEKKDFVIKDRRFFSETEQVKEPAAGEKKQPPPAEPDSEQTASVQEPELETQLPEINFSTFIFSLNASALVNLGIIDNPASGQKEKNVPLAKQTIDILGMLEEKTSGNLTDDEKNLLKNILFDLRLNYVKEKK